MPYIRKKSLLALRQELEASKQRNRQLQQILDKVPVKTLEGGLWLPSKTTIELIKKAQNQKVIGDKNVGQ